MDRNFIFFSKSSISFLGNTTVFSRFFQSQISVGTHICKFSIAQIIYSIAHI